MKLLWSFLILVIYTSCSKKKEKLPEVPAVVGDWTSHQRITWLTITEPSSSQDGIPIHWYTRPPKDTFGFPEEKLLFSPNGNLYFQSGIASNNHLSVFSHPVRFPKDTLNYIYDGQTLYLNKNNAVLTFEVLALTNESMTLYKKTTSDRIILEDWSFYKK